MRRVGTSRFAAASTVALLAAAVFVGCGGDDGPPLTRAAFTAKANTECQTLKDAGDEFRKAQDPLATGKQVARYLRAGADRLRELVRNLDRLVPPDSTSGDVDRLLSVLARYADGLDTLAARTGSTQSFRSLLEENSNTVDRLNGLATRAGELVVRLGLTGCVLTA